VSDEVINETHLVRVMISVEIVCSSILPVNDEFPFPNDTLEVLPGVVIGDEEVEEEEVVVVVVNLILLAGLGGEDGDDSGVRSVS